MLLSGHGSSGHSVRAQGRESGLDQIRKQRRGLTSWTEEAGDLRGLFLPLVTVPKTEAMVLGEPRRKIVVTATAGGMTKTIQIFVES